MEVKIASTLLMLSLFGSQIIRADAFLYANGVFTNIVAPGASPGTTGALGINDAGQIVGFFTDSAGIEHGFLDANGVFTSIDFPGAISTVPSGINDSGQIVGSFQPTAAVFPLPGFLYINGAFTTIDFPGMVLGTLLSGINNAGQIVGNIAIGSGFLLDTNGGFTVIIAPGAGASPGSTRAAGINNAGQIVGSFIDPANIEHGFVDTNNTFVTINFPGAPSTVASGINDSGQTIGWIATEFGTPSMGFLESNGDFSLINVPGAVSTQPRGVNDSGQIVGIYTPAPESASPVLLVSGLLGIAILSWRRPARTDSSSLSARL